jgi:sugar/nucleoside kinase (ribokinase family)
VIDYLAIGHVTEDLWPDGRVTAGGTVMYASLCALSLGARVAVLTAAAADFDIAGVFPGISVGRVNSPVSTQFWNVYTDGHRTQFTRPSPVRLAAAHLSAAQRQARIAHLAPVCNEVHVNVTQALAPEVFLGLTPQGWLRRWDAEGRVTQTAANWRDADVFLARADAVVMSIEDINGDWDTAHAWASRTKLLVVTQGELGCTVFQNGVTHQVPAPPVTQVDPTGAGDVFAATLFVSLQQGRGVLAAAAYANCIAATSVTRPQMEGLPSADDLVRCRAETE